MNYLITFIPFHPEINQFCQQVKDKSKIVISKFENK